MSMPRFTAEASVYASQNRYLTGLQGWGSNNGVALAGTCSCSAPCSHPEATCSCPPDPCALCVGPKQCCECTGGTWNGQRCNFP